MKNAEAGDKFVVTFLYYTDRLQYSIFISNNYMAGYSRPKIEKGEIEDMVTMNLGYIEEKI